MFWLIEKSNQQFDKKILELVNNFVFDSENKQVRKIPFIQ